MSTDEKPKSGVLKQLHGSFDRAASMNLGDTRADSVEGAAKMRPGRPIFDSVDGAYMMKVSAQPAQTAKVVVQRAAPAPSVVKPVVKK